MPEIEKNRVTEYLRQYLASYPESEARDVYKVLHQAYHGPGHYICGSTEVMKWFETEWGSIGLSLTSDDIDLFEPVFIRDVTPELYRLNLRPAKRHGIDPDRILDEFQRTATEFPEFYPTKEIGLHQEFINVWRDVVSGMIPGIDMDSYDELTRLVMDNDWPAIKHSETYRLKYNPHYRLVMERFAAG